MDCVLEKVFNPAMRGRRTPDRAPRPKHSISGILIRKSAVVKLALAHSAIWHVRLHLRLIHLLSAASFTW